MKYQTYPPHPDLEGVVHFYWTLEVPYDPKHQKQKIVPDGFVEMTFNFGAAIRRYTSDTEYVLQTGPMVMGQRTKAYLIEPTGPVDSFAVSFYPHGFSLVADRSLDDLVDREVPLAMPFGAAPAKALETALCAAPDTPQRIARMEAFLMERLKSEDSINRVVRATVDALLAAGGSRSIASVLEEHQAQRRMLERQFKKHTGLSPKQWSKALRLHASLQSMLSKEKQSLTSVAYKHHYFDQAHFVKDFKALTGSTPKELLGDEGRAIHCLANMGCV
jgi:AraC-like DNA-binding protein